MKKTLLFIMLLAGCTSLIRNQDGSENLVKLNTEPKDCTFLYQIKSQAAVYSAEDAERYLQNQIAENNEDGQNSYFITNQTIKQNKWIIFAPEKTFIMEANIYNCPNIGKINK